MSSSPQSVPTNAKSPSQECNSLGSNGSNSRWKRSSPDPNKMMMGRSPNVMENNAKRILATTPARRNSNQVERVGSPLLSGYPVSESQHSTKNSKTQCYEFLGRSTWILRRTPITGQQRLFPSRSRWHLRIQNGPPVLHPHGNISQ